MTKSNYGKATELVYSIRKVMSIPNITNIQRLKLLEQWDHKVSLSTYNRIKNWIKDSPQERLDFIAHTEYAQYYIDAIDKMKTMTDDLMFYYHATGDDIDTKVKLAKEVRDSLSLLQNIYTGIIPEKNAKSTVEQETQTSKELLSQQKF